jgi:hypothetical protein
VGAKLDRTCCKNDLWQDSPKTIKYLPPERIRKIPLCNIHNKAISPKTRNNDDDFYTLKVQEHFIPAVYFKKITTDLISHLPIWTNFLSDKISKNIRNVPYHDNVLPNYSVVFKDLKDKQCSEFCVHIHTQAVPKILQLIILKLNNTHYRDNILQMLLTMFLTSYQLKVKCCFVCTCSQWL